MFLILFQKWIIWKCRYNVQETMFIDWYSYKVASTQQINFWCNTMKHCKYVFDSYAMKHCNSKNCWCRCNKTLQFQLIVQCSKNNFYFFIKFCNFKGNILSWKNKIKYKWTRHIPWSLIVWGVYQLCSILWT